MLALLFFGLGLACGRAFQGAISISMRYRVVEDNPYVLSYLTSQAMLLLLMIYPLIPTLPFLGVMILDLGRPCLPRGLAWGQISYPTPRFFQVPGPMDTRWSWIPFGDPGYHDRPWDLPLLLALIFSATLKLRSI